MLCIGWTSYEKNCRILRATTCFKGLAFCVQVESPVRSYYQWNGKVVSTEEYVVRIKHTDNNTSAIKDWLRKNHPYDNPQWITVKACDSLKEYFAWALVQNLVNKVLI